MACRFLSTILNRTSSCSWNRVTRRKILELFFTFESMKHEKKKKKEALKASALQDKTLLLKLGFKFSCYLLKQMTSACSWWLCMLLFPLLFKETVKLCIGYLLFRLCYEPLKIFWVIINFGDIYFMS